MNDSENTVPKQKGEHLFKPGQSGNPKGRPKGALNKTTRAAMVLLENEAEDLTRAVIERAKSGDITAMRLCFERLIPRAKARPLSSAETLPENRLEALNVVIQAINQGIITPSEGRVLVDIVESRHKAQQDDTFGIDFLSQTKSSSTLPEDDDEQ